MGEDKKKMEEIFKQGVDSLESGALQDAINAFEEVLEINEKDAAARFNLGVACMRMARVDIEKDEFLEERSDEEGWMLRAIAEFNKVLDLEPENEDAKENIRILNKLLGMGV
jgi:tetratricopeptide (TPR) repeat protein